METERIELCQTQQDASILTLDAVDELLGVLEKSIDRVFKDIVQPDIGALGYFTRGIGSGKSAVLLFRQGLTEDASALARILLECTMRCNFLLSDETDLDARLARIEIDDLIFQRGINDWLLKLAKKYDQEDPQARVRLKAAEKRHRSLRHQLKKTHGIPEEETIIRSSVGSYFRTQGVADLFGVDYEYLSNAIHVNANSLYHMFELAEDGVRFSATQDELPLIVIHKMHGVLLDLAFTVREGLSFELFSEADLAEHVEVFEAIKASLGELT